MMKLATGENGLFRPRAMMLGRDDRHSSVRGTPEQCRNAKESHIA